MVFKFRRQMELGRWLLSLVTSLAVLETCGCGSSATSPEVLKQLVPVCGTMTFQGQPIAGAVLAFRPADGTQIADDGWTSAVVDPEGKFEVKTSVSRELGHGAVPGEYVVAVSWTKPLKPNSSDSDMGPELLPRRYQDPKSSPLRIKVEDDSRELPNIELTP